MDSNQKMKLLIVTLVVAVSVFVTYKVDINLGLDLQGGTQVTLEAKDFGDVKVSDDAMLGVLAVIRNRVDGLGVSEPVIRRKGFNQVVVQLPGVKDPDRAIKLIGETALLEFAEAEWIDGDVSQLTDENLKILGGPNARLDKLIDTDSSGHVVSERPIILKKTVLTGADLKMASPATDQTGEPVVSIEFTTDGAKIFRDVTARSVGKPLAILLDGKVISAPNINEPIAGGRAQISGRFSIMEMRDLVIKLKAGSLPVPVEIVSNQIVGATLGSDSIEKSKTAGMIGIGLLMLFMLFVYRIPGLAANFALVIYVLICFASLKLFGATLTLPGIAGFILTMGMAVDANVIIFERIKEERAQEQTMFAAIKIGFSKAFVAILDANVTSLIAAIVLFWMGTGSIKGFAVTLSIGILASMFTAIIVTRLFLEGSAKIVVPKNGKLFKV